MFATTTETNWDSLPPNLRLRIGFQTTWRAEHAGQSVYAHNFGLHVGDDAGSVLQRRVALAQALKVAPVWMTQVHGIECARLAGPPDDHTDTVTADAAWTTQPGVAAAIMTADCLPVLVTDHHGRAVAAAHCGWRGLLDGVLQNTVASFADHRFLDGPLHAWLGPCIGPESFEVGNDVRDAFMARHPQCAHFFSPSVAASGDKWLADLQGIAAHMLNVSTPTVISRDKRDTFRDPRLNSFRRDRITGRQVSLIWIKTP